MRKNDVVKVLVWRILSLFLGFIITYSYLGELHSSIELVLIITVVMTIVHYFFEEWWRKVNETR